MEYLPKEVINIIFEYSGIIKYRNGKYMNQILNNDVRYHILTTIPKPVKSVIPYGFCYDVQFNIGYLLSWGILFGTNETFVQHRFCKRLHEDIYTNY